jgi:hypothetical protein
MEIIKKKEIYFHGEKDNPVFIEYDADDLFCYNCKTTNKPLCVERIFRDGRKQIQGICPRCNNSLQYVTQNKNKEDIFYFGKYKGKKMSDVKMEDPGYFKWLLKNGPWKNKDIDRFKKYI